MANEWDKEYRPLFADSWYDEPLISQLRNEIQNLYKLLLALRNRIEEVADSIP